MVNKLNFLPEEWATLLESTTVAGIAVSAAEPSGLWGTLNEFFARSSAIDAANATRIQTNSSRQSLPSSRPSKGRACSIRRCTSASPR